MLFVSNGVGLCLCALKLIVQIEGCKVQRPVAVASASEMTEGKGMLKSRAAHVKERPSKKVRLSQNVAVYDANINN
eukprot:6181345-Pleurochrysis_carterae.AAC.1